LLNYVEQNDLHHTYNITFKELINYVTPRIIDKQEIIDTLEQELNDSECKCLTGIFTRMINSLNGYYPDTNIQITESQEITTIISHLMQNNQDKTHEELIALIKQNLTQRNIPENIINSYLMHLS
jgi:hypothetical protein